MASERPKFRAESPPPRNRGSGPRRSSPVWALAEAARERPGVWLVAELPVKQSQATNTIKHVRGVIRDARYEFTTRKRGDKVTAVYCRFGAKGGKS